MLIQIDFESDIPIYTQLHDQIVVGIADGSLKPDESLPSVRRMSADIGIHAHTVNKSYAALRDEGYIVIDRRSGCRVCGIRSEADDSFLGNLEQKLLPIAAEAACHGLSAQDFGNICADLLTGFKSRRNED